MRLPNALTSLLWAFDSATFPALISTVLAATTIAAICASFGAADSAAVCANDVMATLASKPVSSRPIVCFMIFLLCDFQ
jgi:hypothetical protein